MDVSDRSDIELAGKLGKSYKDLTVADVIDNMPKVNKMIFEAIRDNYMFHRQNEQETIEDVRKLIQHCNELQRNVIIYFTHEMFHNEEWQRARRKINKLEDC